MGRSPCCEKVGLKKGPWTPEEDQKLMSYIEKHGHGSWRALPSKAGLQRCGKSCRLRWTNYLRPDIKRGKFSLQEEQTIIQLHALLGNRWSAIAAQLPKRTDNEIKNYWNTHLKKRLTRMGIDPTTHKPKTDPIGGGSDTNSSQSKDLANLSHMAQWENARLEAEARLVRESKLLLQVQQTQQTNTTQPPPARLVLNKITAAQQQPLLPPCLDVLKAWQNSWSSKPQLSVPSRENFKMHSMYAMMLSTDENLESPTSTLCFPGGASGSSAMLPIMSSTTTSATTITVDALNENLLNPSLTKTKIDSNGTMVTPCDEGVFITKGGNNNETDSSWYMLKQNNPEIELDDDEIVENNNNNNNNSFRDDDIMVAVEAFRGRGGGGYDGVNVVPPTLSSTGDVVVMEAGLICSSNNNNGDDDAHMPYHSNDTLAIINDGDGSICNVSLEENKHYWNTILNLVNDAQVMF
ncbi:hypothetical protein HN51_013766 [Arachis hypogaea]|uniref:Uncharacterized protein n=1 Tax=Arachis hypogaea TaxID=3818 RepID=A0A445DNT1_ARAHY|nr:myb-related protein 306-like [Arachis ipaensis]QHO59577.1 uncharacterized protein DS421_3g100220 [Arachis hypogaea]RYR64832.1 hypothetical protein Ahy_A03g010867 [Arachis hypogaea]